MALMDNGQMETVVVVKYNDLVFKNNKDGHLRHLRVYVRRWLKTHVGEHAPSFSNCTEAYPWRCRTMDINEHHVFLFRNKRDAMLFKLRFG